MLSGSMASLRLMDSCTLQDLTAGALSRLGGLALDGVLGVWGSFWDQTAAGSSQQEVGVHDAFALHLDFSTVVQYIAGVVQLPKKK